MPNTINCGLTLIAMILIWCNFRILESSRNLESLNSWIVYRDTKILHGINCWCKCRQGNKTIGACSHIIAVLVWLGIKKGRIEKTTTAPRAKEFSKHILSVDGWNFCADSLWNQKHNQNSQRKSIFS